MLDYEDLNEMRINVQIKLILVRSIKEDWNA